MIIALGSDKGSPGATTLAVALGLMWPGDRLVCELDPRGADLPFRLMTPAGQHMGPVPSVGTLAIDARPGAAPPQLARYAQQTVLGVPVIRGEVSPRAAGKVAAHLPAIASVAAGWQGTVITDVGSLQASSPALVVAKAASIVLLVMRASTEGLGHLRDRIDELSAYVGDELREWTIKDSNPKNLLHLARNWLGTNPLTGERYMPHARSAGQRSGTALYRVGGLLVDWDLFTALRTRAEAREAQGQDGLSDLVAALELVSGQPLTGRRRKKDKAGSTGWGWLVNDDVSADEAVMTGAIVDVAHLVVTRALEAGDPDSLALARQVAELAVNLGCGSDKPLLNLAAVCEAQGRTAELAATVRRIVTHHGKVVEEDIPTDTYDVLLRRNWVGLTAASWVASCQLANLTDGG